MVKSSRSCFFLTVSFLILLFLYSCASSGVPNAVQLDSARKSSIKKIAILGMAEPQRFMVSDGSSSTVGGLLGGAVGGLIAGSVERSRAENYVKMINDKKISLATSFYSSMLTKLNGKGFQAIYYPNEKPKLAEDKKTDSYYHINVDSDILLNVWYGNTGYFAKSATAPYEPFITLFIRILDSKTKEILFYQAYRVGVTFNDPNVIFLPLEGSYSYKTYDDLISNFDKSIEGLTKNQEKVVERFLQELNL